MDQAQVVPEDVMQLALNVGELGGTVGHVRAIETAYAEGQRDARTRCAQALMAVGRSTKGDGHAFVLGLAKLVSEWLIGK